MKQYKVIWASRGERVLVTSQCSQRSSAMVRILQYLLNKGIPMEYNIEDLKDSYVLLDWIACQLVFARPEKGKHLLLCGKANEQKRIIFDLLEPVLRLSEDHSHFDLSVIYAFELAREEVGIKMVELLDREERKQVPIILVGNEFTPSLPSSIIDQFMILRLDYQQPLLKEERLIATLYGCMERRLMQHSNSDGGEMLMEIEKVKMTVIKDLRRPSGDEEDILLSKLEYRIHSMMNSPIKRIIREHARIQEVKLWDEDEESWAADPSRDSNDIMECRLIAEGVILTDAGQIAVAEPFLFLNKEKERREGYGTEVEPAYMLHIDTEGFSHQFQMQNKILSLIDMAIIPLRKFNPKASIPGTHPIKKSLIWNYRKSPAWNFPHDSDSGAITLNVWRFSDDSEDFASRTLILSNAGTAEHLKKPILVFPMRHQISQNNKESLLEEFHKQLFEYVPHFDIVYRPPDTNPYIYEFLLAVRLFKLSNLYRRVGNLSEWRIERVDSITNELLNEFHDGSLVWKKWRRLEKQLYINKALLSSDIYKLRVLIGLKALSIESLIPFITNHLFAMAEPHKFAKFELTFIEDYGVPEQISTIGKDEELNSTKDSTDEELNSTKEEGS